MAERDMQPNRPGGPEEMEIAPAVNTNVWADFMNPARYELKFSHLKSGPDQSFGFQVSTVLNDGVEVSSVVADGPADRAGIEKGLFVVSVNGKRMLNSASVQTMLDSNRRSLRIVFARKRPVPLDTASPVPLPSTWPRQSNCEYLLMRIDPTDGKRVGTGVGVDRCGRVFISVLVGDSAGSRAGLRMGDRMVAINGTMVIARAQCKQLVKEVQGNPFDMIVERPKDLNTAKQGPCPLVAAVSAAEGGEPSMGIPDTPDDVVVLLDTQARNVLQNIRSRTVASPKERRSKKKVQERRVKLKKEIKTTKLQKP